MKRKSSFHQESELLQLLDQRFKELGLGDGRSYRRPHIAKETVRIAATAHADVNKSDPFARARMELHLRQGYALASEVLADASAQRRARGGHHANRAPSTIAA